MSASIFAGLSNAYQFAYGINPNVEPLRVVVGNAAAGAGSIVIGPSGFIVTEDGRQVFPLSVTAPILVGAGANAETVTPSAVSQNLDGSWTVTATFANVHGTGDLVASGTFGLIEAVNYAHGKGGGVVLIDAAWTAAGGVNGTLTGNKGFINVSIVDARGTASAAAFSYKAASNGANMSASTISWY